MELCPERSGPVGEVPSQVQDGNIWWSIETRDMHTRNAHQPQGQTQNAKTPNHSCSSNSNNSRNNSNNSNSHKHSNARTISATVAPPPPAAAATPSADRRIALSSLQRNDQPS